MADGHPSDVAPLAELLGGLNRLGEEREAEVVASSGT